MRQCEIGQCDTLKSKSNAQLHARMRITQRVENLRMLHLCHFRENTPARQLLTQGRNHTHTSTASRLRENAKPVKEQEAFENHIKFITSKRAASACVIVLLAVTN